MGLVLLVWITGISGSGKSTVCAVLKAHGISAVDTDRDGFNHWVHRKTGEPAVEPPYPVPPGWIDTYAWRIRPERVRALANSRSEGVTFLFGSIENEVDVWDLFDKVGCLVINDDTLRRRLATRTTNLFGKHPSELTQILAWNTDVEAQYLAFGATIIDAAQPLEQVVEEVLALGDA